MIKSDLQDKLKERLEAEGLFREMIIVSDLKILLLEGTQESLLVHLFILQNKKLRPRWIQSDSSKFNELIMLDQN